MERNRTRRTIILAIAATLLVAGAVILFVCRTEEKPPESPPIPSKAEIVGRVMKDFQSVCAGRTAEHTSDIPSVGLDWTGLAPNDLWWCVKGWLVLDQIGIWQSIDRASITATYSHNETSVVVVKVAYTGYELVDPLQKGQKPKVVQRSIVRETLWQFRRDNQWEYLGIRGAFDLKE